MHVMDPEKIHIIYTIMRPAIIIICNGNNNNCNFFNLYTFVRLAIMVIVTTAKQL